MRNLDLIDEKKRNKKKEKASPKKQTPHFARALTRNLDPVDVKKEEKEEERKKKCSHLQKKEKKEKKLISPRTCADAQFGHH